VANQPRRLMTHRQWNATIRRNLAVAAKNPRRALDALETLARELESQIRCSIQAWHLDQTLHVVSLVQSDAGDHQASARTIVRLAKRHEQELQYQRRALVSACAAAAVQLARSGDRSGAAAMLRKGARAAATLHPNERLLRQAKKAIRAMSRPAAPSSKRK
jgi:hypothetical protein